MKTSIFWGKSVVFLVLLTLTAAVGRTAEPGRPRLNIQHDRENRRVIVTGYGAEGQLRRFDRLAGGLRQAVTRETTASLEITGAEAAYALVDSSGNLVSQNMVGYVNLQLPCGMSLIANPLMQSNVTLRSLFPTAP